MTPSDISAKTTHDLWIEARQFTLDISRPTPTTIRLVVKRPVGLEVTDGAVVLIGEKPISASHFPIDGTAYTASTDRAAPADLINGAQVVGAYHEIMGIPFPPHETVVQTVLENATGIPLTYQTFSIDVTNTNPDAIYYASVHAASNVLQYYPIGVQSYPLEGSMIEKGNSTYTGNIPSYPSAPTAPTDGMVYHDQQLNIVQYFHGDSGSWVPTRADTIVAGPYNPGVLGQVYLYAANQLKVFNGKIWVDATNLNFQLRTPTGFVALRSMSSQVTTPESPQIGDMFYDYTIERIHYWDGITWVYPNSTNTLFNSGTAVVPAFITPMTVEPEPLRPPYVGQLFYNQTQKVLNAWNGYSWNQVNTDQEGTPTTDKIAIGTDGSYDERIRLIKTLQGQLGWPLQCVELQEEQYNIAIDNALDNYRQLSDGAYTRGFIIFKLIPNQQLYYLNSAIDKSDSIVDIHKIHRMSPLGIYGGGPNDVWAQAFAAHFYNMAAGTGDILSTHLAAQYGEQLTLLYAGDYTFSWYESRRELTFTRAVRGYETVIMEATLERTEQEILSDRWCKQYIQNWALAELKMMLGLIRSKFSSGTPGPGGTINLNGEMLVSEARQDMVELKEELLNYEYGGHVYQGNVSFLIG